MADKQEIYTGERQSWGKEIELQVFEYIEIWYNKVRRHSAIGNLNIDEFWAKIKNENNNKLVA